MKKGFLLKLSQYDLNLPEILISEYFDTSSLSICSCKNLDEVLTP